MNEQLRLETLRRFDIVGSPPEPPFARLTSLAAELLKTPIAQLSFVDEDRIWFKAEHGVTEGHMDRVPGFCASCIEHDRPWVVPDASVHEVAKNHPFVRTAGVRYYAGASLRTVDGYNLGALCVLDRQPRQPSRRELTTLAHLADIVMDEVELRRQLKRCHVEHAVELAKRELREDRIKALNRELAHRTKNLLATIHAIVRQTATISSDTYPKHLGDRILALASTHDLIIADNWRGVTLEALVSRQMEAATDKRRLTTSGPNVLLSASAAQNLGLALHELVANSLAHGALASSGHIQVSWTVDVAPEQTFLSLTLRDVGRFEQTAGPKGFGLLVLEKLTPLALGGEAAWIAGPEGVTWSLHCPLGSLEPAQSANV